MTDSTATLVVLALVAGLIGLIVGLAIFLWYAAALSRVFARRNVEPWRAWVPVLNEAEILRLGGRPAWTVVFFFIPVVCVYAIVLRALAANRIGRTFGRGAGSTALAVLLPPVWATVLASTREPVATAEAPPARTAPPESEPEPDFGAVATIVEPPVAVAPAVPVAPPMAEVPPAAPASLVEAAAPVAEPVAPPAEPVALPAKPVSPPTEPGAPHAPVAPPTEPVADPAPIRTPFMDAPADIPTPEVAVPDPEPMPEPAPEPAPEPIENGIDLDDEAAETIVVERRAVATWTLVTDDGDRHPLEADVVVLGRRPAGEEHGVQYLAVPDTSRTLSKQHACLTRDGDGWVVTDLQSTNGVFLDLDGVERQLAPGDSAPVSGRLLLGTVGLRIEREDGR